MKIRIISDDKSLVGSILPRWYSIAYRQWDCRRTVLYIIPLNLIVRYAVGIYWFLYNWIKHGEWADRLWKEYRRGYSDGARDTNDRIFQEEFRKIIGGQK